MLARSSSDDPNVGPAISTRDERDQTRAARPGLPSDEAAAPLARMSAPIWCSPRIARGQDRPRGHDAGDGPFRASAPSRLPLVRGPVPHVVETSCSSRPAAALAWSTAAELGADGRSRSEAVAVALERDDFGVVDEPVDHGCGAGRCQPDVTRQIVGCGGAVSMRPSRRSIDTRPGGLPCQSWHRRRSWTRVSAVRTRPRDPGPTWSTRWSGRRSFGCPPYVETAGHM